MPCSLYFSDLRFIMRTLNPNTIKQPASAYALHLHTRGFITDREYEALIGMSAENYEAVRDMLYMFLLLDDSYDLDTIYAGF